MTNSKPISFYRYRSLANGATEYVERTICHNELHFSKPSWFNDPFDCHAIYKPNISFEEFCSTAKKLFPNSLFSASELKSKYGELNHSNEGTEIYYAETHKKVNILCLSTTNNDILMWSHYADSHKGICLEFKQHSPLFSDANFVRYSFNRPMINEGDNDQTRIIKTFLTKSDRWEYEKEWRICKKNDVYEFQPEALTGIILGARISTDDEKKVINWIKAREYPIDLYRSLICDNTFSIKIELLGV